VVAISLKNRDHVPAPEESETPFALQAKVSW
jgi:hypothetical protein